MRPPGRKRSWTGWLAGEDLAMVSDAGTPLVSDPGQRVVEAVLEGRVRRGSHPGPFGGPGGSGRLGLFRGPLLLPGIPAPKGSGAEELLDRIGASPDPVVLFESPERVGDFLVALEEKLRISAAGFSGPGVDQDPRGVHSGHPGGGQDPARGGPAPRGVCPGCGRGR